MTSVIVRPLDPRVGPVEDNLLDFFGLFTDSTVVRTHVEPHVTWFTADVDCPLLNGAVGARFPDPQAAEGAGSVVDRLVAHGRGFTWWVTPTTRTPALEQVLRDRGLVASEVIPGMHSDLTTNRNLEPVDSAISVEAVSTPSRIREATDVMMAGFEMPPDWAAPMAEILGAPPADPAASVVNVIASRDGQPLGGGTVACHHGVAGLYNIAVLPDARGQGAGAEITRALLRIGRAAGCEQAILHASAMGYPVYHRLGFETVCDVQQYSWSPPET